MHARPWARSPEEEQGYRDILLYLTALGSLTRRAQPAELAEVCARVLDRELRRLGAKIRPDDLARIAHDR